MCANYCIFEWEQGGDYKAKRAGRDCDATSESSMKVVGAFKHWDLTGICSQTTTGCNKTWKNVGIPKTSHQDKTLQEIQLGLEWMARCRRLNLAASGPPDRLWRHVSKSATWSQWLIFEYLSPMVMGQIITAHKNGVDEQTSKKSILWIWGIFTKFP